MNMSVVAARMLQNPEEFAEQAAAKGLLPPEEGFIEGQEGAPSAEELQLPREEGDEGMVLPLLAAAGPAAISAVPAAVGAGALGAGALGAGGIGSALSALQGLLPSGQAAGRGAAAVAPPGPQPGAIGGPQAVQELLALLQGGQQQIPSLGALIAGR